MAAILYINAEPFEQIHNMPLSEGPKCNLVKIGQAISEKTFKDYEILYNVYSPGTRADNPGEQNFDCN